MQSYSQRAPFNDWWYWSECLIKRYMTVGEIFRENAEHDRATKASEWVKSLKENPKGAIAIMQKGAKTDEDKAKLKQEEEKAIGIWAGWFRQILNELPFISDAVQNLTYSSWEDCRWVTEEPQEEIDEITGLPLPKKKIVKPETRLSEFFWGPKGREDEGVRSGRFTDGGLPGILYNLLAAERTNSTRAPTDYGRAMAISAQQQRVSNVKMAYGPSSGQM
jgi:hypothetical protein